MLADACDHVKKVIVAVGYTDLRKGIDGLAQIVGTRYHMDPFEKDILFLFCGKRCDRIKGLLWEGDGYLLLYKRLEAGAFTWPRSPEDAAEITSDQYHLLMKGFNPLQHKINTVSPGSVI